ncbi:protein kinase C-binding protein NELL2-like [Mytilus californianus]|uniref:protein kinase C-binding protein NELL2-like n=1 Tax=Mytilus californianus TaxID=6549 RepID=UPI0022452991|nr:protein kinase C-binding protein NELL2-like [Mytilus californianus]
MMWSAGTYIEIDVDASCINGGPSDQCKDAKSTCVLVTGNYKCACNSGYYNNMGTCTNKIIVDASCINGGPLDQCKDVMSTCSQVTGGGYQCTCNSGYYNKDSACTNKIIVDASCINGGPSDQCKDSKSTCSQVTGNYKCTCNSGYYNNGGTCTIKGDNNGACTNGIDDSCLYSDLVCQSNNICTCADVATYYWDPDNKSCKSKINVDVVCINGGPSDQCKDAMSTCVLVSGNHKCACNSGYYNKGGTCTNK